MTGSTCSAKALAEPTTRTVPLTASLGTRTSAWVPAALTVLGRTICSPTAPLASMTWNTTSVVASSAVPCSVSVCPGLTAACAPLAGVPLAPAALMPAKPMPKAALVPPTVATRIGPVAAPLGTVRLMAVLDALRPAERLMSSMRRPPSSTALAPSAKPVPLSCSVLPMKPAPEMATSLIVGTICSSSPTLSRSRRTRAVVAPAGTTAVRVCAPRSTLLGVTVVSPRLPPLSSVVNTSRSLASRPVPETVMVCPVLAEATPVCAALPLAALAPMADRWLVPAASRSRLSV